MDHAAARRGAPQRGRPDRPVRHPPVRAGASGAGGGGPAGATQILVYKVYHDGVKSADIGGSSTQSVVLMVIVIALTVAQFRFIERKVQY